VNSDTDVPTTAARGWHRFFGQLQRDLKLIFFFFAFLGLFRLVFIALFRERIAEASGAAEILAVTLNGARFDGRIAVVWALPALGMSVLCGFLPLERAAGRVRAVVAWLFAVLSVLLSVVNLVYFHEIDDQFNNQIFEVWHDSIATIVASVSGQINIPLLLGGVVVFAAAIGWLAARLSRTPLVGPDRSRRWFRAVPRQIGVTALLVALIVVGSRGSVTSRPVRLRDAAITRDDFLNKVVLNPYSALRYAIKDELELRSGKGLKHWLPDKDVRAAAKRISGRADDLMDLDAYFERTARGPKAEAPRHVFLVIMESYSAWAMMDRYRSLQLAEGLRGLADDGLHVRSFLPASGLTINTYVSLITGYPFSGVKGNKSATSREPYRSSVAQIFKRLGYRTRVFFGGYPSWQRFGDLARDQGFDEVHGGAHMGPWSETNEWGVDDEYLFSYSRDKVVTAGDQPSFNIVFTTTFHGPFDIDVYGKGYPVREVPPDLVDVLDTSHISLPELGHLWYADRELARFVREVEQALPHSVFAITGDHRSRRFLNNKPTLFERQTVPLVLYGRRALEGLSLPDNVAGTHIDILPTLIELAAPEGFRYHAVGLDLLTPRERFWRPGKSSVIGPDFIARIVPFTEVLPVPHTQPPADAPDEEELQAWHHAHAGVAWWRVMRGVQLKAVKQGDSGNP
jgi:hypothetical protein